MKNRALRRFAARAGVGLALFGSPQANADTGLLRVSENSGPYRISIFSQPTPLRVDRGALSILVADRMTGQPLPNVDVQVRIASATDPAHPTSHSAQRRGRGPIFSASFDSPDAVHVCPMHPEFEKTHPGSCPYCGMDLVPLVRAAGPVQIQVEAKSNRGKGSVSFEAQVDAPESAWISLGPALAVPPLGILLFILHQCLSQRMPARRVRGVVK